MKSHAIRLMVFLIMAGTSVAWCQETNDETLAIYYLVRKPRIKHEHPPMLILLHGVGSNEKDLFAFAGQLPGELLVLSARAPFTSGKDAYRWFGVDLSKEQPVYNKEEAEKSRVVLIDFISDMKKKFHPSAVYLCGFSQGAIMSYGVALTDTSKIDGIIALSGRMLPGIKPLALTADKLKTLQVYVAHGNADTVIPISKGREAYLECKRLGTQAVFKEFMMGHAVSEQEMSDAVAWLNKLLKH